MTEKDQNLELEGDVPEQKDPPKEPEYSEEEQTALAKGWKPKDQWEGPEDEWKPAKVFNEIGSLKEKLQEKDKETKKLNKVVTLMKEHHLHVRQSAFNDALRALKQERQEALEKEEFGKAEKIRDQIDELKEKANTGILSPELEQEVQAQTKEPDPSFYEFMDRNPWYKPGGKDEMSKKADALGYAYHLESPELTFPEIIKRVEKDIRQLYPDKFERPKQAVNDTKRGTGVVDTKQKVNLTPEQLEIARSFDMTPEQYAKELASYKGR